MYTPTPTKAKPVTPLLPSTESVSSHTSRSSTLTRQQRISPLPFCAALKSRDSLPKLTHATRDVCAPSCETMGSKPAQSYTLEAERERGMFGLQ